MKKSEFETLIDRAFGVLNARYGLRRVETKFRSGGVTVRFANTTTTAILDYKIGEEPWLTISDSKDDKNKSTLGWLLVEKGIEKAPTPEQAFRDKLLTEANVVGTPGSGFGPAGEGYFRFSAFADRENVLEAMERIKNL